MQYTATVLNAVLSHERENACAKGVECVCVCAGRKGVFLELESQAITVGDGI